MRTIDGERTTIRSHRIDAALRQIRQRAVAAAEARAEAIAAVPPASAPSAANMLHYLALRSSDVRDVQEELARAGLSSLGRCESHVLATVDAAIMANGGVTHDEPHPDAPTFEDGDRLLEASAAALLGPPPAHRRARIMVTLPPDAAASGGLLVDALVDAGMSVARINTAHDTPEAWRAMAANVRRAGAQQGRSCIVVADLAGPKLRTGPLPDGPRVLRLRPRRDLLGRVVERAELELVAAPDSARPSAVAVHDPAFLARLGPGDRVSYVDAREARRLLRVEHAGVGSVVLSGSSTGYLTPDTVLVRMRHGGEACSTTLEIPPTPASILLRPGDVLTLTRGPVPDGDPDRSLSIPCTLPEAFRDVRVGDRAWFDDGKIGGTVTEATAERIRVLVEAARESGSRLRPEKGINLPDTDLRVPALSEADLAHLPIVVPLVDAVALSFASDPADVRRLRHLLDELGGEEVGIVLKIETARGFERLPELLLALLESDRPRGVMIARGDLAVELGWERLAEVQEEILWLAEAAHTPVVWATQVLESMARTGLPSRAEITDAAMGARAECVMLNKGDHLVRAVSTLADILDRMSAHMDKKTNLMRRLRAWDEVPGVGAGGGIR